MENAESRNGNGEHHAAIRQIAAAVAALTPPPLQPLYQTFLEVRAGVQDKRDALMQERMCLRMQGFEAAARLMRSLAEDSPPRRPAYFEQLQEERS